MGALQELTVILPLTIGTMAITLSWGAVANLLEQKACSPWFQPSLNDFICNDTSILAEVSEIMTTRGTIRSVCSGLSAAMFGYWRDVTGLSRPLLIIGAVAEMICSTAYLLAALDWGSSPWIAPIMEAVISGFFGEGVLSIGANCLVIAKSSLEERTMRIQVYMTATLVAALIASFSSGFLLTAVGYTWYFGVAIIFHLLSLISSITLVAEVERQPGLKVGSPIEQMKAVFKPRDNLSVIWIMMICNSVIFNTFSGETSLSLYYNQQKFHFTVRENTLFGTYHFMVSIVGSFLMVVLLVKVLKWSDFKFGIAGSTLSILSSVCMALANSKTVLFLIAPLSVMRMNLFTVPQAIISKCISKDELGVFLGVGSVVGLWVPFLTSFVYNYTFSHTSKTMPGAFYFVSAVCYVLITLLFSFSNCLYKKPIGHELENSETCGNLVHPTEECDNSCMEENL